MKQKTKKATTIESTGEITVTLAQDVKTSVMIVSVLINLFILSLWIALVATSEFDASLVSFFLGR